MDKLTIDDFYSSGEYERILNEFQIAKSDYVSSRFSGFILEFGPDRDDNFRYEDVQFMLRKMHSPEFLFSEETLGVAGSVSRGWFSSTFNRFVILFLAEIRAIICDKRKASAIGKASEVSVGSVVTGLSAWIAVKFGLSDPVAVGLATAVLLSVVYATRGAFCKMTDEEVKAAMDTRVPRTRDNH